MGKQTGQTGQNPVAVDGGMPVIAAVESRRENSRWCGIRIARHGMRDFVGIFPQNAQREPREAIRPIFAKAGRRIRYHETMTPFDSIARTLASALQLTQPPIAISFTDAVPEGVKTYQGSVPAGCRFWQEATTQVFATVPADHELCSIGMYTHHMDSGAAVQTDLQDALKVFGDLGYVRRRICLSFLS